MRESKLFSAYIVCAALCFLSVAGVSPACQRSDESLCQSVLTAKRCGAVKYCKTTVWDKQEPKIAPCHDGGLFVKRAQVKTMHIYNSASKLDTIASLCHDLDEQAMALCKSLVVEAGPEVLQLINSTVVPPVFIGSILGLCTAQDLPHLETTQPQPSNTDIKICNDCKAFLKDIENSFIGPNVQEMMKQRMETVCREVPDSFYNMCKHMSDDWMKHFFAYMNEELQFEKVCDLFLPCDSNEKDTPFSMMDFFNKMKGFTSPLSDVTCKTCKEVMDDVKDFINSPAFQAEAEDFIAVTVCNLMPHHMIGECKRRIMRYGNLVFDIIVAGFDSQLTCEAVRMCPPTGDGWTSLNLKSIFKGFFKRAVKNFLPDLNMLPIFELFGDSMGGTECSLCQLLFKEVEKVIADDQSELQITTAMFEACNLLPEPWADECAQFVKMNGRKIIEDILHNLPPREICFSFGFCEDGKVRNKRDTTIYVISEEQGAKKSTSQMSPEVEEEKSNSVTHGSAWCRICDQIASIVQRLLASQQLNLSVDTIYKQVCAVLPRSIASRCSHLSKHMIDGILGGMSSVAQPQLICGAIGVCDMTLTPMNYSVQLPDALKPPYH